MPSTPALEEAETQTSEFKASQRKGRLSYLKIKIKKARDGGGGTHP